MLPRVREVRNLLRVRNASLEIAVTTGPGDATQIASQIDDKADAVLVAGGDGTVCEVLNGLNGRLMPMTVFSSGTENLLARELQLPRDPIGIANLLLYGAPQKLDMGTLNDKRFLVVAGIGFDAECVARMTQMRRGHITHGDYFWPIWRTYWGHRFPVLRVEADGKTVFEERGIVLIGNMSRYSIGLRPLLLAKPDDGLLDVVALPCSGKREMLLRAFDVLRSKHLKRRGVVYQQCRKFRITSLEHVMMERDGEFAGCLPAVGQVIPGSANVLVERTRTAAHVFEENDRENT